MRFAPYIAPFLVFGLVVFVHELGHFLAAKLCGVYAPVFSLGWGSRWFGWRRGETDYRISVIPIGGYVRMATRDDDSMAGIEGGRDRGDLENPEEAPRAASALWDENSMAPFGPKAVPEDRWVESKSTLARVFILSAGVLMNIVLAVVVLSIGDFIRGKQVQPAIVGVVAPESPAAAAGIAKGDVIVSVNGHATNTFRDAVEQIRASDTVNMNLKRGGEQFSRALVPQDVQVLDSATGKTQTVKRIGIQASDSIIRTPIGLGEAVMSGTNKSWMMAKSVVDVLGGLVTAKVSVRNLGGPIAIARTSVQAAREGAETLWFLIAFLSLNIAILNLVPLPVLDGGQILIVLFERIKGSPFSARSREMFARVGVFSVLALVILVMFNDITALFRK